jgi:hypothetical protein
MVSGIKGKIDRWWKNHIIEPSNPRLVKFNLLVAMTFYSDYILTGLIIGNYDMFYNGIIDETFLNQYYLYYCIVIIQVIDICLNFFK